MSYSSEVLADSPLLYLRLGEASQPAVSATSASSFFSSSFTAAKAFDRDSTTSWTTASGSTGWLQVQYASSFVVTRYALAGRRDATVNRSPKDWQFQGSNDGSSWTTLDTQTGVTTWSAANDMRTYSFTNSTAYAYYRLNVTANNGDALLNVTEFLVVGAYDASSSAKGGAYLNGPTLGVTGAISGDTAATFASASSQDVWVPWWSSLDTTTLTLECWVKTTGTTQAILGRDGSASVPYSLFVNASGALQIVIKNSGTSGVNYDGTTVINNGAWRHVVLVRDGSTNDAWLYVDGVQDAHFTGTVVPQTLAGAGFRVASRGNSFLDGSVDEAALYTTALSSTRIAAHYTAGTTSPGATSGSASLSLSASGAAGASGGGSGSLALTDSGAAGATAGGSGSLTLSGSGAMTPSAPASASGALVLSGSGDATPPGPSGDGSLTLSGTGAADTTSTASGTGSLDLFGAELTPITASGLLELLGTGTFAALIGTDTSNPWDGLELICAGTATVTRPVGSTPSGLAVEYDKALPYPQPVMVSGRPT